ncbi:MAG: hypothetical protein LAP40_28695 [Acidobacteriia bacterium]|nr:hypothetical protein [Terriglobia bacterium]
MRGTLVQGLFVLLLLTGPRPSLPAAEQKPHIISVAPLTAKIGDVVRATGEALGQTTVDQLYLTNSTQDVKIGFVEQTETTITFRIPAGIKPGRWALMIHLKAGAGTGLFEQPVKVTVE